VANEFPTLKSDRSMAMFAEAKRLSPGGVMGIRRPCNFVQPVQNVLEKRVTELVPCAEMALPVIPPLPGCLQTVRDIGSREKDQDSGVLARQEWEKRNRRFALRPCVSGTISL